MNGRWFEMLTLLSTLARPNPVNISSTFCFLKKIHEIFWWLGFAFIFSFVYKFCKFVSICKKLCIRLISYLTFLICRTSDWNKQPRTSHTGETQRFHKIKTILSSVLLEHVVKIKIKHLNQLQCSKYPLTNLNVFF